MGVRVNCVMPGVIETPLLVGMLEQMFDSVEAGMQKLRMCSGASAAQRRRRRHSR